MSSKKRRNVWKPVPVVIEIGETEYDVVSPSMRMYIEFEERLGEILSGLGLGGQQDQGAEDDEAQAEDGEAERKGLVEQGVDVVYEGLKCVIPTLEMSDVLDASEPQLEHAIQVCLDVCGGKWAQTLVNDFLGPLVPALRAIIADRLLGVMGEPALETPVADQEALTEIGAAPPTT